MKDKTTAILRAVAICLILFVVAFFVFSRCIGGTASLGYREGGLYFVGDHGDFVQVSETVWYISLVFGILVNCIYFAFFGLGAALITFGIVLSLREKRAAKREQPSDAGTKRAEKEKKPPFRTNSWLEEQEAKHPCAFFAAYLASSVAVLGIGGVLFAFGVTEIAILMLTLGAAGVVCSFLLKKSK